VVASKHAHFMPVSGSPLCKLTRDRFHPSDVGMIELVDLKNAHDAMEKT
jgi:hypothetical protein